MNNSSPFTFDEFFASGFSESVSPFLSASSRRLSRNLSLKVALLSTFFLILAFILSFFFPNLSYLSLTIVYFLSGSPALIKTCRDFRSFEINIDVLMTLAAFLAILIGNAMEGALLLVLFELSGAMEDSVTSKAKGALHRLHELSPTMAWVIEESGAIYQKSVREISCGTTLLIKAGEIVPLDGVIVEGSSSLNLVHLTGESMPVFATVQSQVPAGARNIESAITVKVTKISSDSTLAKIIQLITQAQEAKPKLQRWLDKFGKGYATSIIALTIIFALSLPLLLSISFWGEEGSIYRALSFMIAASPCALIIATPTAYLSSISSCARKGILLKGGATLDALSLCRIIAFDKTGTLTTGKLKIHSITPLFKEDFNKKEVLSIAAGLEKHVTHPISAAIVDCAQKENIQLASLTEVVTKPGFGLNGIFEKNGEKIQVFIGLSTYIQKQLDPKMQKLFDEKMTYFKKEAQALCVCLIGQDVFVFQFQDSIRENAYLLIESIEKKKQLTPVILTGDHQWTAQSVAKSLGIAQVYADLRPEDKLHIVADLSKNKGLAMVGDGINDAPALARATIGISLGKIGSATAVDASDVVLLNDDLFLINWLFSKAHTTMKIVKQNLSLALGVIVLATTPALLGYIPLWLAVTLHEGGTVLVGINSLRLLKK